MRKPVLLLITVALVFGLILLGGYSLARAQASTLTPNETLGKALFFDPALSINGTQSCSTCHAPQVGFTGPDAQVNAGGAVYPGAIPGRFGNRKPPAAAYAGDSPLLHFDNAKGAWFGGMFWDGRATGEVLGDPLAEQAQGPYLNPLEQAIATPQDLCFLVQQAEYANLFRAVWGSSSLDCVNDPQGAYEKIGRSVAAYERSAEVNPFTSKFDKFWDNAKKAGKDVTKIKCGMGGSMGCGSSGTDRNRWTMFRNLGLSDAELQGLAVFNDRARCSSCHSLQPGSSGYPLFTNFGYANLGVPKNPNNPFYTMPKEWNPDGKNWVDYGLGAYLESAGYLPGVYEPEMGKHKVPTLRNVDLRTSPGFVKAYGHNGFFKSLDEIVTFYQSRAMMGGGCGGMGGGCGGMASFPPPEVNQNLATLTMFPMMQKGNIVAFLKTLSDGYFQR